jgi:pyrroline-5-carboxylate reductase
MGLRLVVVGGGRMGGAIIRGVVSGGWAQADQIVVVEPSEPRRAELSAEMPGLVLLADGAHLDQVEGFHAATGPAARVEGVGALVAVKPLDAEAAFRALGRRGLKRVVSIVAGVRIESLESWLPAGTAVIRAMPNTPALVGAGATAIAHGASCGEEDAAWARELLGTVGYVVSVPERSLDAVTGLSGSGPAYLLLVVEAMIEAGVSAGLPREVSRALTTHTLLGTGRLLVETGEDPEYLRAQVTSPGGTTAAGLRALEARAVRSAFIEAVSAATERARELGA